LRRWEIYWADAPFEDDPAQSKLRPVVILNDKIVYVLASKITSHEARENAAYDHVVIHWEEAGLKKPSVVRVDKLLQLKPEQIKDRIGQLSLVDIAAIQKLMNDFMKRR